MKHLNRIFSLLLALLMVFSLLPLATFAEEPLPGEEPGVEEVIPVPYIVNVSAVCYTKSDMKTEVGTPYTTSLEETEPVTVDKNTFGAFMKYDGKLYEFIGVFFEGSLHKSVTVNYAINLKAVYIPHTHRYVQGYNRTHHWMVCRCGSTIQKAKHVDPATDADSTCTCGYKFSNNADLTYLWLRNMVLSPRFNRGTTEYIGAIHTYKDFTSTEVCYGTFDSLATVEVFGGTEIHDGLNVFEVTVTAEDRKTTKTYTVFASKPVKVGNLVVYNSATLDGDRYTIVSPFALMRNGIARFAASETLTKAMIDQAAVNESTHIHVEPVFSKWSAKAFALTLSAESLTAISEGCDADLLIKTFMADVTIPNDLLADLAKEGDTITFQVDRLPSVELSILAGDKEIDVSDKITVDVK